MSDQDSTIAILIGKVTDVSEKIGTLDGHYQGLDQRITDIAGNVRAILDKMEAYVILTHSHATILSDNKEVFSKLSVLSGVWEILKVIGKWAFMFVSAISAFIASIWTLVPQMYEKITSCVHNFFIHFWDIFK